MKTISRGTESTVMATALASLALLFATSAHGGQWDFVEVVIDPNPMSSDSLNQLQVADFDGDGLPDLWVSNDGDGEHQMFWYRNHGNSEERWDRYGIMPGIWRGATLADVNRDQKPDIVAYSEQEQASYWLANDGAPEDRGWVRNPLPETDRTAQFGVVDLNDDAAPELVVATPGSPLQILNQSNASSDEWTVITLAHESDATTASFADLDGDGSVDIAAGNSWFINPFPDKDWRDGANWTAQAFTDEDRPETQSLIADIDNDGRNDVILAEPTLGIIWLRRTEDDDQSWQKSVVAGPDSVAFPIALALADVNGDRQVDLVVGEASETATQRLMVLEKTEDAAQPWAAHVFAELGADALAVADFNDDGRTDIVSKNFDGDTQLRIWLNDFDQGPSLKRWRRHVVGTDLLSPPLAVATVDLDGDSLPDIAAGASWWRNPGTLSGDWTQHDIGAPLKNVVAAHDLDEDGDMDMIGTDGSELPPRGREISWAENDGSGAFNVRDVGPAGDGDFPQSVQVGPLINGNGLAVAISWHNAIDADPPKGTQIYRVPADARADWEWERLHELSTGEDMALGDIDGDGDLDIHLGTVWLRNDGGGSFHPLPAAVLDEGRPGRVRLHDINRDGLPDVVLTIKEGNQIVWAQNPGDASGGEWPMQRINLDPIRSESLDVADLDHDGDAEVVAGEHRGRGRVFVFENKENGSEWAPYIVEPGIEDDGGIVDLVKTLVGQGELAAIDHRNGTQLIDLDQDGDFDIVSAGWYPKNLLIYENLAINEAPSVKATVE